MHLPDELLIDARRDESDPNRSASHTVSHPDPHYHGTVVSGAPASHHGSSHHSSGGGGGGGVYNPLALLFRDEKHAFNGEEVISLGPPVVVVIVALCAFVVDLCVFCVFCVLLCCGSDSRCVPAIVGFSPEKLSQFLETE